MTGGKVGSPKVSGRLLVGGSSSTRTPTAAGAKSPFFRPSTPTEIQKITTPNGSTKLAERKKDTQETKSTLLGAYANLVSVIVGAGIVAIPFAIRETGLVAGLFMIVLCAMITQKSLCLLIETGKHVEAPSYETLLEAAFGRTGFLFISLNMFLMNFGSMVSYLIILKVTISEVFGIEPDDLFLRRSILVGSSCLVILPLAMQRDMAQLSRTSTICVLCDFIMVLVIAIFSPIKQSVGSPKQLLKVALNSTIHPQTFFIGLGVLSFAFVCQDSCFIIAGSLKNPTRDRWRKVTGLALGTCAILAIICGTSGYLGFGADTVGNVLHNFEDLDNPTTKVAANIARALLGITMFFVFPLASFVVRHICVVLLFHGQRAHEGDDHAILARKDRRVALTVILYVLALMPALLFENLGTVLAFTGAIGGSCLSYIGPGIAYLGIHGDEFLLIVKKFWPSRKFLLCSPGVPQRFNQSTNKGELRKIEEGVQPAKLFVPFVSDDNSSLLNESAKQQEEDVFEEDDDDGSDEEAFTQEPWCFTSVFLLSIRVAAWFFLLMPIWCWIATTGQNGLAKYMEKQGLKGEKSYRLGRIAHRKKHAKRVLQQQQQRLQQEVEMKLTHGKENNEDLESNESIGSDEDPVKRTPALLHSNSDSEVIAGEYSKSRSLSFDNVPKYLPPMNSNENLVLQPNDTTTTTSYGSITETRKDYSIDIAPSKPWAPNQIGKILRQTASPDPSVEGGVDEPIEDDPQDNFPTLFDFVIAIVYILLGVVAGTCGIISIVMS